MNIEINVSIVGPDGICHDHHIANFNKQYEYSGDIGLSIAEGKELLLNLQRELIAAQTTAYCASRCGCAGCGRKLRCKGRNQIGLRTVFGDVSVESPRFYHCACAKEKAQTFSPLTELLPDHIAPELLWLETKWASLVSYGVTVDLLKDVLPIGAALKPETVRRHLERVAGRMESELDEEQFSFIQTSPHQRTQLPNPEGPITVGIDGGYVRSRHPEQAHFEVTVGKSISTDGPNRYLGLVQSLDEKPKRRLNEVLKDQGWQENQPVTFMTDGGDTVLNIAQYMAPASEHILDWFHITMRISVMHQYVKGLVHHNADEAEAVSRLLRQIKGFLWNGNLHDGQIAIEDLNDELEEIETAYESIKALRKAATEFRTYISNCAWMITNYPERKRYGERVSTGFVESTVNSVVSKRFCKRQQMQ